MKSWRKIRGILLIEALVLYILSCGEAVNVVKKERVLFSINDTQQELRRCELVFEVGGEKFEFPIVSDSVIYSLDTSNHRFLGIHFKDSTRNLFFDSIPVSVIAQSQHINLEFGLRDKAGLTKNEHIQSVYKYFAINPQEHGLGFYWEKPIDFELQKPTSKH
jgi:hypothetical protein